MAANRDDLLAPVTLVTGNEELLVDRAVSDVLAAARKRDSGTEIHELTSTDLEPGRLTDLSSPSLFGEPRVIVLRGAEQAGKDLVAELGDLVDQKLDDVTLVVVHTAANRGKAVLELLTKAGARKVDCPQVKKYADRLKFVGAEVRRLRGSITEDAARSLLDAVGNDLRELAMACAQLVADAAEEGGGTATVTPDVVARYYTGHADATSFTVADRAVEGRPADALEQLRWALTVGIAPVLVTGALAQALRSLVQVRDAGPQRSGELARELAMPPWKIDKVRKQLRGWTDDSIMRAVHAVAEADVQVKGESADPSYALERAVVTIARCARAAG